MDGWIFYILNIEQNCLYHDCWMKARVDSYALKHQGHVSLGPTYLNSQSAFVTSFLMEYRNTPKTFYSCCKASLFFSVSWPMPPEWKAVILWAIIVKMFGGLRHSRSGTVNFVVFNCVTVTYCTIKDVSGWILFQCVPLSFVVLDFESCLKLIFFPGWYCLVVHRRIWTTHCNNCSFASDTFHVILWWQLWLKKSAHQVVFLLTVITLLPTIRPVEYIRNSDLWLTTILKFRFEYILIFLRTEGWQISVTVHIKRMVYNTGCFSCSCCVKQTASCDNADTADCE